MVTYGFAAGAEIRGEGAVIDGRGARVAVFAEGERLGEVALVVPGRHKSIEGALTLSDSYEQLLTALALHSVHTATHHDANPFSRLQSLPGVGDLLALGML